MAIITDIVVIGGGHAGIEAAHAAASLGAKVVLAAVRADRIGWMPCNPSIGGPAKGHLTREVDALGGLQARITDETTLHIRWLNTKKGPAVQALRAQCDKPKYAEVSQRHLNENPNITIMEGIVTDLIVEENSARGVIFENGAVVHSKSVILATGTFLGGMIYRGEERISAGRDGEAPAIGLAESLRKLNLPMARLKTGTVPRISRDSIDFDSMEIQPSDESRPRFSYIRNIPNDLPELPCYITHTTEKTREIIQDNLHRAALFSGDITGAGPRYCPSIEDKYNKFPDKIQHPVFVEPEAGVGPLSEEIYLQGLSTSLPADVQDEYVRSIPGLERAKIIWYGYAIEYDYIDPLSVTTWCASKQIPNLFFAGQILGTTGYEEAASLGLICGINALRLINSEEPFVLDRNQAYIGVMTDDLATRGIADPYRMLTGRAEWRLLLKFDDADRRLTPTGRELGTVDDTRWEFYLERENEIKKLRAFMDNTNARSDVVLGMSVSSKETRSLSKWMKVPEVNIFDLRDKGLFDSEYQDDTLATVASEIKYIGYLERQKGEVQRLERSERVKIPAGFNYAEITSISMESREKLAKVMPRTLGQASRISGVKPSDIAVLDILLSRNR